MAVKYSGSLRFTDEIKAKIDLAADGAVEKAVIIDGDGVETPIGGGASDFTTAEVTITNNTGSNIEMALPQVVNDAHGNFLRGTIRAVGDSSHSYLIPLYKGSARGAFITENLPSAVCTGDVSIGSNNGITITGNGTITFGPASEG